MYPNDIQGWCDFHDIYDEAVRDAQDGGILVEVGCWLGKSSAHLALAAQNSGKNLTCVFVDTWKGELGQTAHTEIVQAHGGNMAPAWRMNMIACGVDMARTRQLQMTSIEAAKKFEDGSLDFVFIDGAHDYESVKADLAAWLPKLKATGHIAGHDYGWHEVERAVNETMNARRRNSSWERIQNSQS